MSPRTVATYRDGFVLFLDFTTAHLHKQPTTMKLQDITPALILAFLDQLEQDRGNAVRTRNARLAALRAFMKFAGHRDVNALHVVEQALGVPMKRFERPMLGFLSREEMLAIIGKPGSSWTSQRDHLLLHLLYNTGARVSEIIGVRLVDVVLDGAACVHLHGKGRKQHDAAVALDGEGGSIVVEVQPGPAARIGAAAQPGRAHDDKDQHRAAACGCCGGGDIKDAEPARPPHLPPHHPPHDSHASAAVGRTDRGHRPVARPRVPDDDPSVHGSQPGNEGEGTGSDARPRHRQPALPRHGLAAGVPEGPVIMRSARVPGHPVYEVIPTLVFHGLVITEVFS